MTAKAEYLRWRRGAPVGCVYARYLAGRPNQLGQQLEVLKSKTPARAAQAIDERVSTWVVDATVAAATLLLPKIDALERLVDVALELGLKAGWHVTRTPLEDTPEGPVLAFRVARDVPRADGTQVPSEALVLGPFDAFPATRRAPVTALEIFVGKAPNVDRQGQPTRKANLADLELSPPLTQAMVNNMWDKSFDARLASLGGVDDIRAKAKVSFVVPMRIAEAMGCVP